MFLQGSGTVTFSPGANQTQTVSDGIADQTGSGGTGGNAGVWTLSKTGAGTLVLGGTNSYSGGTTVTGGTLSISSDANLGNGGTLALEDGTTLDYGAGGTYSGHPITVAGDPSFNVGSGLTVTENDQISDGATPGTVEKTGSARWCSVQPTAIAAAPRSSAARSRSPPAAIWAMAGRWRWRTGQP
jgi:autotransporter-associated beta strand protein